MRKMIGNNEKMTFLTTFIAAFIVIVIFMTLAMVFIGKALDSQPFGDNGVPAIDDIEFDFVIPDDSPFFKVFTEAEKVNVLLLGVNQGLTDTIMLVSFDTKNKRIDLISIPRDTYYQREGYNSAAERKINAAYRKNPINTARAVHEILLGIPINYYAVIDYEGIKKIVDSMGGVPMDIPFPMKYTDLYDKPPLYINIPKGEQVLDGEHAVQFLRFREGDKGYQSYPEGDIGRVKAQQRFMVNAFKKCISFELPKIAATVFENITSDIDLKIVLYLAGKGVGITGDDITTYTMPGTPDPKSPYYVYPKAKEIAEMLIEIYSMEKNEEPEEEGE